MNKLPKTIKIQKSVGETPLAALDKLRLERPELNGVKLAYAGRLDPMASGELLVVVGEECKRHKKYLGLDKEYEVEILFGLESDTGDILGIVKEFNGTLKYHLNGIFPESESLVEVLRGLVGEIEMPYPVYSSKTVEGVPLFKWALEERLGEIEVPTRKSHIYKIRLDSLNKIAKEDLEKRIYSQINLLPEVTEGSKELGRDFRREDVLNSWKEVFDGEVGEYVVAKIRVACSSGTYMRSLVNVIAEDLGTHALALSIHRTIIGKYFFGFWFRK